MLSTKCDGGFLYKKKKNIDVAASSDLLLAEQCLVDRLCPEHLIHHYGVRWNKLKEMQEKEPNEVKTVPFVARCQGRSPEVGSLLLWHVCASAHRELHIGVSYLQNSPEIERKRLMYADTNTDLGRGLG